MIRNILSMFGIVAALSPCLLATNDPTMEPSTYQQIAACLFVGGQPVFGENVYFQTTVNTGSGYHSHYVDRPKGSFYTWTGNDSGQATTGGDGCAYIYWYAPQASGGHDILATSTIGGSSSFHIMVWTNSSAAMSELAASADYSLVGSTGDHPYNHFGTSTAIWGIQNMMADFRQMTGVVAQVNDMSLGWGGTFDLGPAYAGSTCPVDAAQYWTNSCVHAEHRIGRNADIPYAGLGGYNSTFITVANQYGGGSGAGGILPEGNHYHLRFNF